MIVSRRLAASALVLALAGCAASAPPQPDPTGLANADMFRVLTALAAMNPKPIESLTPAEARRQPTGSSATTLTAQPRSGRTPG